MDGITFLFARDFRQTLPIVTRGTRADEVNACVKRSNIWRTVQTVSLTINMRVQLGGDADIHEFSTTLLNLGDGKILETDGAICLPPSLCRTVSSLAELIEKVYGHIESINLHDDVWLCERVILAPRNEEVMP